MNIYLCLKKKLAFQEIFNFQHIWLNKPKCRGYLELQKCKTRIVSSNPQITSSNPRVRRLKAQVATRLKTRIGRLKAQVRKLKARVEAMKPSVKTSV